jgi:hypothetical protein
MTNDQGVNEIKPLMTRDPNPASEIEDALRSARGEQRNASMRWPKVNTGQLEGVAQDGPGVLDLWKLSPFPMRVGDSRADEIVDILFPGNPWLCVGQSDRRFRTQRRDKWRGRLDAHALIVPSPMTHEMGVTKKGYQSHHSLENTAARRFLIIESDQGQLDQQAAVIWHLGNFGALAAIVFSGNKSVHGWFACNQATDNTLLRFMRYAVSLGADNRMWLRSQFCRIPDGRRSDAKKSAALLMSGVKGVPAGRQALIYLNPEVIS